MRRRDFITLLGSVAVAWPTAARVQQAKKIWLIGFISGASRASVFDNILVGFPQGMRELGYVEGKDFTIE
jgi:hypothetical protein